MDLIPSQISRPLSRLGSAAQNALEVARFGGLETGEVASAFEVVHEDRNYRLRRYFADGEAPAKGKGAKASPRPPVLLVPPMMLAADVYDVSPNATAVGSLHENGADPWVVDFGAPEREEGGLERNLADHVIAVSDAVDHVREVTGADVHLGGYSQGGMFCYQAAAYRRSEGLASVITFGSPVDTRAALPFGIPADVAIRGAGLLAGGFSHIALPAWASRTGFRLMDPAKSLRSRLQFVLQLHDREALLPRERQRRFLEAEGWVAWPGPALADFVRQFIEHNRMLEGGFVIEGRLVTLADIDCPVLTFVGEVDEIAPAPGVRAIREAAPLAEIYEVSLRAGHFGLVVGSAASQTTWPVVAGWSKWRSGDGELPASVVHVDDATEAAREPISPRAGLGVELAVGAGVGIARTLTGSALRTVRGLEGLTREAATAFPRLARLDTLEPNTRMSVGLLLDEQAKHSPDKVFFLFEDRAHTYAAAKNRTDAVVRGLISLGVHQGDHVGVLMGPRPSSLAIVAALSRLGAVAVLMRPDGDLAREAELGHVSQIVADPEHAELATTISEDVHTFLLGGGAQPRDLGLPLTDMERIDPDDVPLPAWYRPNPGRASDLAFIMFSGAGEGLKANRISNRRWALSAFGTASSAALTSADTVYAVTPLYHPSGLLMSIGGAIAGGARLAMATEYQPATFWDEARRYGVTVASYTWTGMHDLVEAPPNPSERGHSVRLLIGSGMPRGLWRRIDRRFERARVLEFYASTEGEAILVNLSGAKAGSLGRPLPGSAQVRIARWDLEEARLILGADGFAIECEIGETGMLLAGSTSRTARDPLRSVFARDDAWYATGDLFKRDRDGDHWLIDNVAALIRTSSGPVAGRPISDALGELSAVDLAVAYPLEGEDDGAQRVAAAVSLRKGHELTASDLDSALADLDESHRPVLVRVVDEIPVTTWFRPVTASLRDDGVPEPEAGGGAFCQGSEGGYEPLTASARKRLAAAAA
jgi:putative long chain acyl-CoA synthase